MKKSGRILRCPVCNGRMEYKAIDYWCDRPKNVCSRCGYDGSFAFEWDNDDLMEDYRPKNGKQRKKRAVSIEDDKLRSITRFYAILYIITFIILCGLAIIGFIKMNVM
ncbi:MAG: hypothetical protein LUQ50_00120 [Methanospirillum sp.]|uniref:hypothetical protein n=1 Tax=Methanospirillum sp. TaxID=45200 RepID=UPI00236F1C44|nr:hypothetical protein [Methanospirillum sp.]MDD1727455.1 hypothetical protein [Methanospirillum sp.]